MKKFEFSLQKVLKYKAQRLEIEMNVLALKRYELYEKEVQLSNTVRELEDIHQKYQMQVSQGMSKQDISKYQYFKEVLEQQKKSIEEEIEALHEVIEAQLLVVLEFKKDVSGLEKLREKQLEEYSEEMRKEEAEFILEMITNKMMYPET